MITTEWREQLANEIRNVANAIFAEADRLADQPDYMTGFDIWLRFPVDGVAEYEVTHTHIPTQTGD